VELGEVEYKSHLLSRFDQARWRELLRTLRSDGTPVLEVWPINSTISYLTTTSGELARELFEEYGHCSTHENERGENFAWQFVVSNARISAHRRRYEILVNKLSSKEESNTSA
jgi:hypothetical protein